MTALGAFGLFCLVLACFSAPIYLIVSVYEKPKRARNGNVIPKQDRTSYWDYLIVVLPIWLLLIVLFSTDEEQRSTSVILLSWGYSYLIVSSYNRRIDILLIKVMLLLVSVIVFLAGLYLHGQAIDETFLYVPLLVFLYLIITREIIKFLSGSFPITLDKYFRVGFYFDRYRRKTNIWDAIWSVANFLVPLSFFMLLGKII